MCVCGSSTLLSIFTPITPNAVELASCQHSVTLVFSTDPFGPSFVEQISVAGFHATVGLVFLSKNYFNWCQFTLSYVEHLYIKYLCGADDVPRVLLSTKKVVPVLHHLQGHPEAPRHFIAT